MECLVFFYLGGAGGLFLAGDPAQSVVEVSSQCLILVALKVFWLAVLHFKTFFFAERALILDLKRFAV